MNKILIQIVGWLLFITGIIIVIPIIIYHFQNPEFSRMMVFKIFWKQYLSGILLVTAGGAYISKRS
jgi:uncharacterized membrane protein HdeD (DUF308 family)